MHNTNNKYRVLLGSISISHEKWLPYASGTLISYAKSHLSVQSYIFEEPLYVFLRDSELEQRLKNIDILGLSIYVWNQGICESYSKKFKQINPDGIVIWGGPSIPKEKEELINFGRNFSFVDHFITGMAEEPFTDLLEKIAQNNLRSSILPRHIVSTQPALPKDHDSSPYLDGVFESILKRESNIKASFETNRGCPYRCSFCDWGGQANSKILKINRALVEKNIDYLFSKPSVSEIEILDANFGLFPEDVETVEKMILAQNKYNLAHNISYSGLAKNGSSYLHKILRKMNKELNMQQRHLKLSFQSHFDGTLEINKRKNIDNKKITKLMDSVYETKDMNITSELILGLPGDHGDSWLYTLQKDIDIGLAFSRAYILSVAVNTVIKEPDFINSHNIKFKTVRFPIALREIPRTHLIKYCDGAEVNREQYEENQIIRECSSYDITELKKMYQYWWVHHNFYNSKAINHFLKKISDSGIKYSHWIDQFILKSRRDPILKPQLDWIDRFVETYFSKDDFVEIVDFSIYSFVSGPMRTTEMYHVWKNQNHVKEFLTNFFQKQLVSLKHSSDLKTDLNAWRPYDPTFKYNNLLETEANIKQ